MQSIRHAFLVRQCAHVAAALHVVLPAQRYEATPPSTDVAGEQREVAQRQHVVDGVVVFGDAEGPQDLALATRRVCMCDLADRLGRYTRDLGGHLERVRLDRRRELVVALRGMRDEFGVHQTRVDDLAGDRVGQGDVGTDVDAKPQVGELRRRRTPRVDAVHLRPVVQPLHQVVEEDGVRFTRIRTPQENHVGVLDFLVRDRSATRSEHCRQTDDRRSVSSSVAGVDVVRPHHHACELLGEEVDFVRRLRAREHAERIRVRSVGDHRARGAQSACRTIERFVPRRLAQFALRPVGEAVAHHRCRQPWQLRFRQASRHVGDSLGTGARSPLSHSGKLLPRRQVTRT